ncbi:hypothetical protein Taro_045266 [Colocasia esculenta]|uniref:Uncharacterized protein n=1 Tax=Colocasia esculenta TaxID=4460 RepID=A0A843X6C4_COLES|nr:hypothetical protein [Colocasia esculenta]
MLFNFLVSPTTTTAHSPTASCPPFGTLLRSSGANPVQKFPNPLGAHFRILLLLLPGVCFALPPRARRSRRPLADASGHICSTGFVRRVFRQKD